MSTFVKACVPKVFASMSSFVLAISRSLRPLLFVMGLQLVPQIPFHIVVSSAPTFAFQSPCAMSMSFLVTCSMTLYSYS